MRRRLIAWTLGVCWALAVLLVPSSASWASGEPPEPSPSPSPSDGSSTGAEQEPTDEQTTDQTTEPSPSPEPTTAPEDDPTVTTTETATTCGGDGEPACVMVIDADQWEQLQEADTVLTVGVSVLVLTQLASLVGSWGRR